MGNRNTKHTSSGCLPKGTHTSPRLFETRRQGGFPQRGLEETVGAAGGAGGG